MQEIRIPEGIEAKIEGSTIVVKGKAGTAKKEFNKKFIDVAIEGNKISLKPNEDKKLSRRGRFIENAVAGELKGMFASVSNKIEKKMRIIFAHFPISLEVKDNTLYIKNIFGERVPRKAKIVGETKLDIKGQDVIVSGADPYDVGQTIANIRKACYVRDKDTRVFQDGLYLLKEE